MKELKKRMINFSKYKIKRYGLNNLLRYSKENESLITYFDTSISSLNVGDEIINEAGRAHVSRIFLDEQFYISNTHNGISGKGICDANDSKLRIVCGTNLLDSKVAYGAGSWNLSVLDCLRLKSIVFMGVGASKYFDKIGFVNKLCYKKIFSKKYLHSVRDEYTKKVLMDMGINNVINTGCPTTWGFTAEFCKEIRTIKSSKVVFTLTDYSKDVELDTFLIKTLLAEYNEVYFWPQGSGDMAYFQELGISNVFIIPPRLKEYTDFLELNEVDFIGTRLHGGIRAMQSKQRAIIISIDNRAREKAKDINLPVIERTELKLNLAKRINENIVTELRINFDAIDTWCKQFK